VPGAVLDWFSREQDNVFHGAAPPVGWRAATPADNLAPGARRDVSENRLQGRLVGVDASGVKVIGQEQSAYIKAMC
jgi:hypothetical protein